MAVMKSISALPPPEAPVIADSSLPIEGMLAQIRSPGPAPTAGSYAPSARNYLVRLTNNGTLPGRARWASRGVSVLPMFRSGGPGSSSLPSSLA